jgi:hypothetical protein
MNLKISENAAAKGCVALFFAIGCFVIYHYKGTGDTGDSITHYFFARYAFVHPQNFFDHWAKPFFVLVASPFAQLGFQGIKFFNLLNATATLWLTYRLAQRLNLANPIVALLILATCSGYFALTFSGLTEHFFALMLVGSVLLFLTEGVFWGAIIVSFLPFVRSEGLLMVGVVGVYLLLKKEWKALPLLAVGHIVYGLAGATVHGSVLWIFTKIPYATTNAYGSGSFFDFFEKLYYLTGIPQFAFWALGFVSVFFFLKKNLPFRKNRDFVPQQYSALILLVFGSFFVLFVAHGLFWQFGIFMSMGLSRVLNAVMPMFAIIGLCGFNFIQTFLTSKNAKMTVNTLLISYLLVFPFTPNPAAINPQQNLMPEGDQIVATQIAEMLKTQFPNHTYYLLHPQIALSLDMDYYDKTKIRDFGLWQQPLPDNAVLIWDSRFCVIDGGIGLDKVANDPRLERLESFQAKNDWSFVVFKLKNKTPQ